MPTIDADAHILEPDCMWDGLDGNDRQFRPRVLLVDEKVAVAGRRGNEFWLIDSNLVSKTRDPERARTPRESAELTDVPARLRHMDELGIDTQVIYPTSLLGALVLARPQTQVALDRCYNRFMANVWRQAGDRLRWVVVPPVLAMDEALEELRIGKEHGACGVLMHGLLGDRTPTDPYYEPLYEEAQRLDMPICIHAGLANNAFATIFHSRNQSLWNSKVPVVTAFDSLVQSEIPARFPTLRWGFIESSASWVPYLFHHIELSRMRTQHKDFAYDLMERCRLYVAIETNDDLPYIIKYTGEDHLVLGTDYGHTDPTGEVQAFQIMKEKSTVGPAIIQKIVDTNARALYGI